MPFTAIQRFSEVAGIHDPDAFTRFRTLIRALDREYLSFRRLQAEEGQKQPEPVARKRRGNG